PVLSSNRGPCGFHAVTHRDRWYTACSRGCQQVHRCAGARRTRCGCGGPIAYRVPASVPSRLRSLVGTSAARKTAEPCRRPSMADAADDVINLLPHKPLALEGLDAQLVEVVRRAKGRAATPQLPDGGGWLMIEVSGDDDATALRNAKALIADSAALDTVVHPAGVEATRLWQIRADGAGLGSRTADGDPAWPGWEDAAVPPEHLGEYLRELSTLMDSHELSGLAYGHFGDGCIHLRIDFPLASTP